MEATQFDNKMNYLEKNKIDINAVKNHKQFIKTNELILQIQYGFKSEMHVFTEEINKIDLSSNDDKIIQWIDLIETCI